MATVTDNTTEPDTDDDTAEAAEPTEAAELEDTTPEPEKTGKSRRVLVAALAVLYLLTIAGCGFLGWQLWQQHQVARAGDDARQAAVTYAQILTSIDSGKVDENFAQVLDGATGEFKDMYSQSSVQLRQLLIDNKAAAHGIVTESAVQSASKDKVVVLLFVDQSVQNTNVPDPRIDRSRVKMTMEYVDGRWRAAKVELP
jgi:Mce-associated membrane protein